MKTRIINLIVPLLGCLAFSQVARAGTTLNVDVVNTPNFNVVNTPANPVPLLDVDNAARQAFQAEAVGGFADGASTIDTGVTGAAGIPITTVPLGQVLVIEHVSVFGTVLLGQTMNSTKLVVSEAGTFMHEMGHHLSLSHQGTSADGSRDYFVASQQVRLYAGPGTVVYGYAERDSTSGAIPSSVTFTIAGYFVECSSCH